MLTAGTLKSSVPGPTSHHGTDQFWRWCSTCPAMLPVWLSQRCGRVGVLRSLVSVPGLGIVAASMIGAAVLAPQFSGQVQPLAAQPRDVTAEKAAVRPLQPRIRSTVPQMASEAALICTNARQKLWTEDGWVVRRVSVCR
jgi:hypothetical protein